MQALPIAANCALTYTEEGRQQGRPPVCTYSSAPEGLQAEFVRQLADSHGVGQVLLVRKHQQNRVSELILLKLFQSESENKLYIIGQMFTQLALLFKLYCSCYKHYTD